MRSFRLAFFATGNGTALRAIAAAIEIGDLASKIGLVVTNNDAGGAMRWVRGSGIRTLLISGIDPQEDARCLDALDSAGIDLILLTGYMRKIGLPILDQYAPRIWNVHPALLPKYGGKGMYGNRVHKAVLAAGERRTGATIHRVDPEYDTGPILLQSAIDVREGEPVESLSDRVKGLECTLLQYALDQMEQGNLEP